MARYGKELVILILQLGMFYIFPLFAGPTDTMGMVFLILLTTVLLSTLIGVLSGSNWKFLYPIVTAVAFIPSAFIYYNASALIHSLWYLVASIIGLIPGALTHRLIYKMRSK